MTEKMLHVRVAGALGWAELEFLPPKNSMNMDDKGSWVGYTAPAVIGEKREVPRYDTDWSATGPLIERYRIQVWHQEDDPHLAEIFGEQPGGDWRATHAACACPGLGAAIGETPLIAVCRLIVSLKEAGKLAA